MLQAELVAILLLAQDKSCAMYYISIGYSNLCYVIMLQAELVAIIYAQQQVVVLCLGIQHSCMHNTSRACIIITSLWLVMHKSKLLC